jgi:hypothetical protein
MLEELQSTITALPPDMSRGDVQRSILEDNLLQRPSLSSRAKVFRKLGERYFRASQPVASARLVSAIRASPHYVGLFAYAMLLWNDALAFTLGLDWLAPQITSGSLPVVTADVEAALLTLAQHRAPEIAGWSAATRQHVARHYLSLLRDCGYATGTARKLLRRPFIPPDVIWFGAELILGSGEPAKAILDHPLFGAMGLSVTEIVDALTELSAQGRIRFAIQGDVVHLQRVP